MDLNFDFGKETPRETGGPSPILGLDELLEAYNSLQAAGKLKRMKQRKSRQQSDAVTSLSKEPGIRFETHSYFFAEYRDPVPSHANQRNPNQEAHLSLFLTGTFSEQVRLASRIYSMWKENFETEIEIILHDHLANTVCYRSSKCQLFIPGLTPMLYSD